MRLALIAALTLLAACGADGPPVPPPAKPGPAVTISGEAHVGVKAKL